MLSAVVEARGIWATSKAGKSTATDMRLDPSASARAVDGAVFFLFLSAVCSSLRARNDRRSRGIGGLGAWFVSRGQENLQEGSLAVDQNPGIRPFVS